MIINPKNIWQLLFLKGILFIIFGIFAIGWPTVMLAALAFIFAFLILFSGIFSLIAGVTSINRAHNYWFLTIFIGIFEIGIGIYAFTNPGISIAALVLLIGFTLIIRGILETVSAFDNAYSGSHKALIAFSGLLGIIAGIVVLKYPLAGSIAFIWILGVYALAAGVIYIALSMMTKITIDRITKSV